MINWMQTTKNVVLTMAVSVAVLGLGSAGAFAGGDPIEGIKITPIEADIRCEAEGGGLGFAYPTHDAPARIWMTDIGEDEGLEVEVKSFCETAKGSFTFVAQVLKNTEITGEAKNFRLDFSVREISTGRVMEIKQLKCEKVIQ